VVLGHLTTMTKREAWIKVQSLGGHVSNTPRPSSDYFIQGERVSARRQALAEELGFPILSEQEFLDAVDAARAQAATRDAGVTLTPSPFPR
jgi:NAD-dependent DNA ligase